MDVARDQKNGLLIVCLNIRLIQYHYNNSQHIFVRKQHVHYFICAEKCNAEVPNHDLSATLHDIHINSKHI